MTGPNFDLSKIMELVQGLQQNINVNDITDKLQAARFSGESGGGLVKTVVNGLQEVISLKLDPELYLEPDREMVEDLIIAALNKALGQARIAMPQAAASNLFSQGSLNMGFPPGDSD